MDKKCCIIFPNQLFRESIFIDSDYKIFLIEEDLFFNQYNFHKQKISFHRSSMKFYEEYLIKKGLDVNYVNSNYKKFFTSTRSLFGNQIQNVSANIESNKRKDDFLVNIEESLKIMNNLTIWSNLIRK